MVKRNRKNRWEDDRLEFTCRRPLKKPGFKWLVFLDEKAIEWQGDDSAETLDHISLVPLEDAEFVDYHPLDDEALFREFAFIEPTPETIFDFANEYGYIGRSDFDLSFGFKGWKEENAMMRYLVRLWEMAIHGDVQGLSEFITWQGDRVHIKHPIRRDVPAEYHQKEFSKKRRSGHLPEHFEIDQAKVVETAWIYLKETVWNRLDVPHHAKPCEDGDLRAPALKFVQAVLDDKLRWHEAANARLIWSIQENAPRLRYVPRDLLGCMYLQLAMAVTGGWEFRECATCGRSFRLLPGVNRADKATCSGTCRTYLYRSRIKQARELHKAGKSIREIVKELEVGNPGWNPKKKMETVKSWIAREH